MVAVGMAAKSGYITGGGPSDPRLRANLVRQGWQPYSIKIGNTYVSFKRMEPFSTVIGLAADLTDIMGNAKDHDEVQTAAAALGMAFAKNVTSKTWAKGMSTLLEAIENPDRYGPKVVEQLIRSMVPRGIAQVEKSVDPGKRHVRDLIDAIKQDVPGWSDSLPADLNIWGEPIVYGDGGFVSGMINPFYTREWKPNPVDTALNDLKIGFDKPPETIPNSGGRMRFDPWEYHDYAEKAGQIAKADLTKLITTDKTYKKRNDLMKELMIKRVYGGAKEKAWAWMTKKSKHATTMQQVIKDFNKVREEEYRE